MSNGELVSDRPLTVGEVLDKAAKSAVRGGTAGACAMGANVFALMWMRTTVSKNTEDYHQSLIYLRDTQSRFNLSYKPNI